MPANGKITATDDRGVIEIVEAIIDDTRELVDAHVDTLREEMSERFSGLGAALTSTLLAFSFTIVTALLLGIAIALTLGALGLPLWAAFWIVTAVGVVTGYALVRRVQRKAKETSEAASDVANIVRENVAQISSQTAQLRSEA